VGRGIIPFTACSQQRHKTLVGRGIIPFTGVIRFICLIRAEQHKPRLSVLVHKARKTLLVVELSSLQAT
jgi:hypothetical protein